MCETTWEALIYQIAFNSLSLEGVTISIAVRVHGYQCVNLSDVIMFSLI
jgi:hypothetical protein